MIDQTQPGNSGLTVSRMALGAMTFGNYSFGTFRARIEQQTADNMVGIALDAGINVFDSAENYGNGQSEELLGRALRNAGARDRVVIATEVSISGGDFGRPRQPPAQLPPRCRQRRAGAEAARDGLDRPVSAPRPRLRDPVAGDTASPR